MTVVQCYLRNQGPPALLWNSTLSLFSCLPLPSSWPNPSTAHSKPPYMPAITLTILSGIPWLLMIFHRLSLCTESKVFSKSKKCAYRPTLHSFACSKMFVSIKICSVVLLLGPNQPAPAEMENTSKVGKGWGEEERKGKVWRKLTGKWRDEEEVQHWGEE